MNNSQDDQQSKDVLSKASSSASTVTEQERELARQAQEEFTRGDYGSCAASCQKLELLRPQDLKVTHNKIVVDYYRSNDPKRTEILRKSLNAICGTGVKNSVPATTGNQQQLQPQQGVTPGSNNVAVASSDSDDVERSVVRYNQAVVLYHLGQYQAALKIVGNLFTSVEFMEETLVHKICLLLIELHLALNRPDDALIFVNYIESQFTSNTKESKSSLQENSIVSKTNLKPPPVIMPGDKEPKKDSIDMAADAFKIKLLKYKLRIYLKTLQVGLCIKEWNTLVSLGMPRNLSTIFLEANLEYLKKNYKHSMTLLNNIRNDKCPDFKSCGESIAVLYYNNIASIHFAMGKPNLACYYLKTALNENKKAIESIGKDENVNNTGNSKSLVTSSHQHSTLPSLHTLGWNRHYELTYSLGVSLLYSGQPTKAFDCFTETAQHIHNNPRLWLRMAECCILCHKESNKIDFDIAGRRKDIVQKVIDENNGTGVARKFILTPSLSQNSKYKPQGLSYAIPQPTLEFGMLCLKNAYFILTTAKKEEPSVPIVKQQPVGGVGEMDDDKKLSLDNSLSFSPNHKLGSITPNNSTPQRQPSEKSEKSEISEATTIENLNLMISILAASAYVSLCLGDYKPALGYAKSLLAIQRLPGAYWLLGNLYAAESLIYLDRIREALEYLKPDSLQNVQTYLRIEDKDMKIDEVILQKPSKVSWFPTNVATAKVILKYNLAVAYAIRGELDKSGEILKQVWTSKGPDCDVPIHVIMLALYIELQLGHVEIARTLIKQHCSMPHQ